MEIERIDEMRLDRADVVEIAALLDACFDASFAGRSFYQQRHHVRFLTRRDGRIVGHMALAIRDIRMGDQPVTVVGLADVGTDPASRGQGIASALLRATITEAKQTAAEFYMLFGDAALYAANGFKPHTNPIRFISLIGNRTRTVYEKPSDGLMIMPLRDRDWDGDALIDLAGHAF